MPIPPSEPLQLADLLDLARWQRLQDHFVNVLGIPIRTFSPQRELLVNPSWPTVFQTDQAIAALRIGEEIERLLPEREPPEHISSLTTLHGITYAAVPVRADAKRIVAYFVIGPLIVGPREGEATFRRHAVEIGEDPKTLWSVVMSLKTHTFAGIHSVLSLIQEAGTSLAQCAYEGRRRGPAAPARAGAEDGEARFYTDRVLSSLLDTATLATKADLGSVMMFDDEHQVLRIRASKGLPPKVVEEAEVKAGEGIAGFFASDQDVHLLDDQVTDPIVQSRMKRREIVSSLVAPLKPEQTDSPIGVLNLATTHPEHRFTEEHVVLLRRLLDLTNIALRSLSPSR